MTTSNGLRARTLHEWRCVFCHATTWSTCAPKPGALIHRVPVCACGKPAHHATGATQQVFYAPRRRRGEQ